LLRIDYDYDDEKEEGFVIELVLVTT